MNLPVSPIRILGVVVLPILLVGCSAATTQREQDANARAARLGHPEVAYTELVSPGTASALGFLPFGAAGFYVGDSRLAATGLLWPFSILWMPGKAYNKAVDANDRDFESRLMRALEGSNAPGDS
jgi:hypothetical protein